MKQYRKLAIGVASVGIALAAAAAFAAPGAMEGGMGGMHGKMSGSMHGGSHGGHQAAEGKEGPIALRDSLLLLAHGGYSGALPPRGWEKWVVPPNG